MHSRRTVREASARRLSELGVAGRVRGHDDTDVLPPLIWEPDPVPSDSPAPAVPSVPSDSAVPAVTAAPVVAAGRHRSDHDRRGGLVGALASRWSLEIDPGRRTAVVVGVVAALVAVATGAWVLSNRPHALALSSAPAAATASSEHRVKSAGAVASPPVTGPPLVVDVAGSVRKPGIYTLPAGARVYDAIKAAGGAVPGVPMTSLNLAARVSDGQQILVGSAAGAGAAAASGGQAGAQPGAGLVNLNTASLQQLDALPGVGPVLAQHILDWRTAHGQFSSVDQLREVSGIGDSKFGSLEPLVTV